MKPILQTYFDFFFSLLKLKNKLLVVLQQGDLSLQRSSFQRLQQSGILASLLSELRLSLCLKQLQLFKHTILLVNYALQEVHGYYNIRKTSNTFTKEN